MSTPRTIEEITPAWLTEALGPRFPGVLVDSVSIEDIMRGMATKVRVRPCYRPGGIAMPETLIVKGHLNGHELGNSFSFQLEMRAYLEVVPTARVHTPDCLFAGDGAGGPVLILQDLRPLGASFLDPSQPLDYAQATRFLQALAGIHAYWWDLPALRDQHSATGFSEASAGSRQMQAYFLDNVQPPTWNKMAELPRGLAIPRDLRDQASVARSMSRYLAFRHVRPRTLSHGDEHLSNFYLLPDGTPGLLDWQSRPEPWSTGFAYFMALTLDVLDRRAWERDLLGSYLRELAAAGGPRLDFAAAWIDYRESIIFPYTIWFTNRPSWQPEAYIAACATRAAWAVWDLEAFGLT